MQSCSTPEATHNRTTCLLHRLPGELRNAIYKLVLDDFFAYDRSRREIVYWIRLITEGESVVLKGKVFESVPGLESVYAPSQPGPCNLHKTL
jgi:hypothetical protein